MTESLRLERALAPLFPGWAARRAQQRLAFDLAARYYDAARPSRSTKTWRAPGTSARTEVWPALQSLRNRSRDLARNNPWGLKATRMLPAHMVGTGVTPRPTAGAEVTRKRASTAWQRWSEATDIETGAGFAAQQHLVARTLVESGEALVLWEPVVNAPGGFTTRVLEPDYLDETYNEFSRNGGGKIVNGIEFDQAGRRVAYHLFKEHPGDLIPMLLPARSRVRIEARFVDHIFEVMRPGQVRGVPWMAASALRLRDLDDYLEAERWRKKIAAAFAAFVTSPSPAAVSPMGAQRTETGPDGAQRGIERIAPGTIKRLLPGEGVEFPSLPGDHGVEGYLRWELFAIAAGIGVPYAELTGDLSNANYSSMRLGKIEFWTLLDSWQWLMLQPMLLSRAWARVQAAEGVPGMACEWSFPKRQWVDPEKEINAEIKAIRAGLISQPDAIAARGDDWRQVLGEQAAFNAVVDAAGLVFDTDPRKVSINGQSSNSGAGSAGAGDQAQQQN